MCRSHLAAIALATALCAGCTASDEPAAAPPATGGGGEEAVVRRVVDGDTLIARLDGDDVRVRMLGVDAPESVAEDRPVECFGPQASARAKALLPRGALVTLTTDPSQGRFDRFDRLLAEVSVAGSATTINERLIAEGYAEVFRGDGRGRLQPRLRAAERAARDARLGLWAACPSRG
jgi:micrococcal nuclease